VSCRCSVNGLFGSAVPIGGGDGGWWNRWLCGGGGGGGWLGISLGGGGGGLGLG
jgi:hypothetical protein